ncbi:MAG: efflux RND transporter periplasmic adaptor subunit [Burkholderiaceae bacterium]
MRAWLKWGVTALVVAALAWGVTRTLGQRKAQQAVAAERVAQRAQAPIELGAADTVQLASSMLEQGLPISGSLRAANSAIVKARVAGEVQALSLREGDPVQEGQIVARIDPTDAQARLRQAQQQAESAKAQIDIARKTFDNNSALVAQGFISRSALDTSVSSLAAAEANFRAAQAGVELAAKSLEDTVLRAPIGGQIAQRLAQNGERVAVDVRVLEIVDLRRIELEASMSAADSLQLRLGQVAQLQIEGASAPVNGRLVRINPSVVAGSRSVLAYLALDNAQGLRQGLFAQGTLRTGSVQALLAPLSAVRTDKPSPYVQLVRDSKVLHQSVELGLRGESQGQPVVELKGLQAGERLIIGAVGVLPEGSAVRLATGAN